MAFFHRKKKEDLHAVAAAPEKSEEKKAPVKKAAPAGSSGKKDSAKEVFAASILVKPLVTEKVARLGSEGVYAFRVADKATKVTVRQAIKARYGIEPRRVNTVWVLGKVVRFGRSEGKRSDWKKAVVFLKKGDHIDVHEGV